MLKLIQLESSTSCNAHCKICPRDQMTRQKGQMSDVLFHKIVADGMDMGVVQLSRIAMVFSVEIIHNKQQKLLARMT